MAFRIKVVTIGAPDRWAKPAIEHWARRIGVFAALDFVHTRAKTPRKLDEALRKQLDDSAIALTRRGDMKTTHQWAELLEEMKLANRNPTFLIGGADGLPANIIDKCKRKISLSQVTLQHDVALIVLLEQIFRALSINAGTPYHRGE